MKEFDISSDPLYAEPLPELNDYQIQWALAHNHHLTDLNNPIVKRFIGTLAPKSPEDAAERQDRSSAGGALWVIDELEVGDIESAQSMIDQYHEQHTNGSGTAGNSLIKLMALGFIDEIQEGTINQLPTEQLKIARTILEDIAKPNIRGRIDWTAIHHAIDTESVPPEKTNQPIRVYLGGTKK